MARISARVVIVGGGMGGWLAALMLKSHAQAMDAKLEITIVESSKIPTVGVGEGTTAVFRQTLQDLALDEAEFIRETGATVKFGIRHTDWLRKGHSYDGPIDDPNLLAYSSQLGLTEQQSALDIYAVASGRRVQDIHLFGELMRRNKAPFGLDGDELVQAAPFMHALHFDQARVGAYLRKTTKGVNRIDAEVTGVRKDGESGNILALVTSDGEIEGDFFIDCTGFRRKLICEAMGAEWISYSDVLPVNRAMPFWLEHEEGGEIAPYTLAWAREAGWMWTISTQDRIGCGYVYCDRFKTADEAKAEIEAALGHEIQPRADLKFDSGRLDRTWIKNCLALGLASSFLEPLEATSIHATVVQIYHFIDLFLGAPGKDIEKTRQDYNAFAATQLTDFRNFLNLHYMGEREEPFWTMMRNECQHEVTRGMIDYWSSTMPRRRDFAELPRNLPHVNEQLYYPVLDGLGHLNRDVARKEIAANPKVRAHARKAVERQVKDIRRTAGKCLGHREYLQKVVAGNVNFKW